MALFNVPGLSDFVAPRRNALLGLASGLARGTDLSQGLAYGFQGAAQGQQADDAWATAQKAEAERQRQIEEASALKSKYAEFFTQQGRPDIARGIADGIVEPGAAYWDFIEPKSGGDPLKTVGGHLYNSETGEWISPPATDNRQNISLQGQWGQDAQGNPVFLQPSSTGEMIPAQVPEGVSLMGPYDVSAQRSAGGKFGGLTGDAQFSLPAMEKELEQSLASVKKLSDEDVSAGKDEWFGQVGALPRGMWVQGGTNMAKFQVAATNVIDRSWLSARAMLKGGGPITDYESNKAENAVSMMKGALEKGDKK